MDSVLDNLFSILPIVLVVIWLIRRGSRRSGQQSRAGNQKVADGSKGKTTSLRNAGTASPTGEKPQSGHGVINKVMAKFNEMSEEMQGGKPAAPRGEEELYARMDSHRIEVRPPEVKPSRAPENRHTAFTEADVATRKPDASVQEEQGESSLERISRLPPLAQGILWSVILDEPPALKDPNRR